MDAGTDTFFCFYFLPVLSILPVSCLSLAVYSGLMQTIVDVWAVDFCSALHHRRTKQSAAAFWTNVANTCGSSVFCGFL